MKLKNSVAIVLFLAVLTAGSIIILGLLKENFGITYFLFVLFTLLMGVYLIKDKFEKKDLVLVFIFVIIISGFAVYSAKGTVDYANKNKDFILNNTNMIAQIDAMTKTNTDYLNYVNYLRDQIITVQSNSIHLQNQINSLILQQQAAQQQALQVPLPQPTQPIPNPPIIPRYEEDDND